MLKAESVINVGRRERESANNNNNNHGYKGKKCKPTKAIDQRDPISDSVDCRMDDLFSSRARRINQFIPFSNKHSDSERERSK